MKDEQAPGHTKSKVFIKTCQKRFSPLEITYIFNAADFKTRQSLWWWEKSIPFGPTSGWRELKNVEERILGGPPCWQCDHCWRTQSNDFKGQTSPAGNSEMSPCTFNLGLGQQHLPETEVGCEFVLGLPHYSYHLQISIISLHSLLNKQNYGKLIWVGTSPMWEISTNSNNFFK